MKPVQFSLDLPSFSKIKSLRDSWTWQEIRWGMVHQLVSMADVISLAAEKLEEHCEHRDVLLELSSEDRYSLVIDRKVDLLCLLEDPEPEETVRMVWRIVLLAWLYYTEKNEASLQDKAELLYGDFDNPEDMDDLVGLPAGSFAGPRGIRKALETYLSENSDLISPQKTTARRA